MQNYEQFKAAILAELRSIPQQERERACVTCMCGEHGTYSINDLIREIESDSEHGRELVEGYRQILREEEPS